MVPAACRPPVPFAAAKPPRIRSWRSKLSSRTCVRVLKLSRQSRIRGGFSLTYYANPCACFRALHELFNLRAAFRASHELFNLKVILYA